MNKPIELPPPAELLFSSASDALVSEVHHRVGNSLALIAGILRMQGRSLTSHGDTVPVADVRLLVAEVGQRLEAVGRLHGRLSHREGPADLADYLCDIVKSAVAALAFAGRVRLHFDLAEGCVVSGAMAPLVGLAVSELVMNAIKFAHPTGVTGHLLVGCSRRDDMIVVEVVDDGVGLPEGFDPAVDGRFGLQLLRSLASQLKGWLEFDNTGLGLSVRLSLPAGVTR